VVFVAVCDSVYHYDLLIISSCIRFEYFLSSTQ
jgi:hypothetical protein